MLALEIQSLFIFFLILTLVEVLVAWMITRLLPFPNRWVWFVFLSNLLSAPLLMMIQYISPLLLSAGLFIFDTAIIIFFNRSGYKIWRILIFVFIYAFISYGFLSMSIRFFPLI